MKTVKKAIRPAFAFLEAEEWRCYGRNRSYFIARVVHGVIKAISFK